MTRHVSGRRVDQDIHADMDAGADAVGSAELGHPDEHVDAELLGPAHVEGQQPVLQTGDRQARLHSGAGRRQK